MLCVVRNAVGELTAKLGFSEPDCRAVVRAVDEALTNIIRHAYQLREDQLIALSLESQPDCVRLRLRDYGKQPIPDTLRRPRVNIVKPGGLGLYLIRNAFDQVDYVLRTRGTELVLTKRISC